MSVVTKLIRPLLSGCRVVARSERCMSNTSYNYETLSVTEPSPFVIHVELNRPAKMNALNNDMWMSIGDVFRRLDMDADCRVVVLSGAGKMFSSGIDLGDFSALASIVYSEDDVARKSLKMYNHLRKLQEQFTDLERCKKPIISCVHNACVGGGVDLFTATDIRLCTQDAWFCVKEVDIGLAADVGTLQRLPKVIGNQSLVNELCLTARKMLSAEAASCGLVSSVHASKEEMLKAGLGMAADMAAKSPVAVQGTKANLVYSRDHSVAEGLEYVGRWNMAMLQSEDVMKSAMAAMDRDSKEPPEFEKF